MLPTRHHTPTDNDIKMKTKLFPTLIILWYLQFYIFTILYWLQILPYRITTTRSRCILRLWDSFLWITVSSFHKMSVIYLRPDDGLVIEAETCCHLVTINKINIHNTGCVLTCESLLLTCIWRLADDPIQGRISHKVVWPYAIKIQGKEAYSSTLSWSRC